MAIADRVFDTTQIPTQLVRINGVPLLPSAPTSSAGVPGVLSIRGGESYDAPVPYAEIEVNRLPTWIQRGHQVLIDAGYGIETMRLFTGGVLSRGDEDPEYFRSQCFVRGRTDEDGNTIEVTASLIGGPTIWPPIPAGQYIDFAIDNHLLHDATKASEVAARELARQARIPRRPSGDIVRRTIYCVGDLYGAFRSYQIPARDLGGVSVEDAIAGVLEDSGVQSFVLSVPSYTLAADATLERMPGSQMLDKLMQIDGCRVQQLKSGIVVVRVVNEQPAPTPSFTYSTTQQQYARIIDATGELQVPFNPLLQIGQTIRLEIGHLDIASNWFLYGHRWEIGPGGAWSYLDLRGGGDFGGTFGINPIASFVYTVELEVMGDDIYAIVTFDASSSFDPDGSIASYAWSDNQTTTPELSTITSPIATVRAAFGGLSGDWEVTLTVTDNDGLTHSVTQVIEVAALGTGVVVPAMYVAMLTRASASADGGETWNDQSATDIISAGARPADGINSGHACFGTSGGAILRTEDFCATAPATVLAAVGSAVNYIAWDWRNTNVVWAITEDCRLYISVDAGETWTLYDNLRTKLGLAGALGNKIGLPAAGGVWIYGGDGAGRPLIAFDPVVGSHGWVRQTLTGDIAVDTPGAAGLRIVDSKAPGDGWAHIILANASGGGAGLVAIYASNSPPGATANYVRAAGLDAGLTQGRVMLDNHPLSPTRRLALFDNRDVWKTTDYLNWTKTADVLPSGVTPNHGLFLSDVLTGIVGMADAYVLACENAGSTLGLYKSTDALASVQALRPATGFPAWPSGAKAKQISIGAPARTVATFGRLAKIGAGYTVESFDGSSRWMTLGDMGSPTGGFSQLTRFADGRILGLVNRGNSGDLYYSDDDGETWIITLDHDANVGVFGYDVDANGNILAVSGNSSSTSGGNATKPLQVWKSTDGGATWALLHTDPGYSTNFNTPPDAGVSPSIVCDRADANRIWVLTLGVTIPSARPEFIYSVDGGATWTQVTAPADDPPFGALSTDSLQIVAGGRLFAIENRSSSNPTRAWKSDDFGNSWDQVTLPISSTADGFLAPWVPTHFNRVVIAIAQRVYISRDRGDSFAEVGVGDVGFNIGSIDCDATTDTIAVLSSSRTVPGVKLITGAFDGTPALVDITYNATAVPTSSQYGIGYSR